jgi:LCP family protein required for cell wall assembly
MVNPRTSKWLRRTLIGVLVLANILVFGSYFFVQHVTGTFEANLNRDSDVAPALTPTTQRPTDTSGPGETIPRSAVTFLVIGSDSREGLDDLQNFGDFPGQRADVIMLVKVYPDENRAQIVSLPRDLEADIAGHGTNRINAALSYGGAELMVRTVQSETGIPINHYVELDLAGFAAIVDELGGVQMTFPYPARDLKSGFDVGAGTQTLDGAMALAYARSRHYQELIDGTWTSVDSSDIGRTRRQQQLILTIMEGLRRPSSIADAASLVGALASHVTVDSTLAQNEIVDLAWALRSINGSSIETATLPTYGQMVDDRSLQVPKEPEASDLLARFAVGDPLSTEVLETIRIQVLNGNGVPGAAAAMADKLKGTGIEIVDVGDAQNSDYAVTQIIASPENMIYAREIAKTAGVGVATPGTVPSSVDVIVIVGADAKG